MKKAQKQEPTTRRDILKEDNCSWDWMNIPLTFVSDRQEIHYKKYFRLEIRKFNGRKKKEKLLCMAYVLHEDRLLEEPSEDGNLYTKIRECNGLTSNIIRVGMKLMIP